MTAFSEPAARASTADSAAPRCGLTNSFSALGCNAVTRPPLANETVRG